MRGEFFLSDGAGVSDLYGFIYSACFLFVVVQQYSDGYVRVILVLWFEKAFGINRANGSMFGWGLQLLEVDYALFLFT